MLQELMVNFLQLSLRQKGFAKFKSFLHRRFKTQASNLSSSRHDHYHTNAMATSKEKPLIAVCQMTSTSDKEANFEVCKSLIETSKQRNAKVVFLPEAFDLIGESREQTLELAEPMDGSLMHRFRELAKEHQLWLSLGGFHERGPEGSKKIYNAHVLIDGSGDIAAVYRKLHLFNVDIPGTRLQESEYVLPGKELLSPIATPAGMLGLGICYDLRFPEFSLSLAKSGAHILTYPSAFTEKTGMAHWEALLRARAIESQCYVVAAAQTGRHNKKRASYGHAMVVDPWGCVVACCREGTNVALVEIDLDFVSKVRREMPVFQHRRTDIYGTNFEVPQDTKSIDERPYYIFGQVNIRSTQLFYKTGLSMAFVNKKPVVPGHVLISPLRPALRCTDLTQQEVSDLFQTVQKVQRVIEKLQNVSSSTIAVQDGPEAGQTIQHVHVHILPRRPGDFPRNDDIYLELQEHENNTKPDRTEEEMAEEAHQLRSFFS